MRAPSQGPGRRRWMIALPLVLVVVLAAGWSGFWFYAAHQAQATIAAWREREAKAGRHYTCGQQTIGGYPFRIEVYCSKPAVDLPTNDPPLAFKALTAHLAAQVYDPTLLIGEFGGPLDVAIAGRPSLEMHWTLAQSSLRGRPSAPERLAVVLDGATVDRMVAYGPERIANAGHIEVHARLASGTVHDHPVLDLALSLVAASAPALHPLAAQPFDLDIVAILHGLDDLAPVPLPVRLRRWQEAGGRLEITRARLRQGNALAVAAGSLGLDPSGRPQGELQVTAAGIDQLLAPLGLDQIAPANSAAGRLAPALGALDLLVPGLSKVARNHAGMGVAAGLALIGRPAELEGRQAVALPLRIADGLIYLGPIKVGQVKSVY